MPKRTTIIHQKSNKEEQKFFAKEKKTSGEKN